jgi:hypothetical protein
MMTCALLLIAAAPHAEAALVGQWNLNEVVAGKTPVVIGSQDGVINGDVVLKAGGPPTTYLPDDTTITNSYHFESDGKVGDNINLGSGEELSPGHITVALWAKANGGEQWGDAFLSKFGPPYASGCSWELGISGVSGNLYFRTTTGVYAQEAFAGEWDPTPFSITNFGDGEWHHIVGTHDGSTTSLYVDGELIGALPLSGNLNNNSDTDCLVAQRPWAPWEIPFKGLIGPILVFDEALTAAQVKSLVVPEPSTTVLFPILLAALAIWKVARRRADK